VRDAAPEAEDADDELVLVFPSSDAFLAAYDESSPHGSVTYPTRRRPAVGRVVTVEVRLGRRRAPVLLRGRVAFCRRGHYLRSIRAAVGVELLATEAAKRDFLLKLARHEASCARRHQRWPVTLKVTCESPAAAPPFAGRLLDIGFGGALLQTAATVGEELVVQLVPPRADVAMALTARVVWAAQRAGRERAYGIRWMARDRGGEDRIHELIQRFLPPAGQLQRR
jgi:Tfp pilus assembly protein PilZ